MQPLIFAFGVFVFVAINLLILSYTTYLSNSKKAGVGAGAERAGAQEEASSH
jgi:hypothetical protein